MLCIYFLNYTIFFFASSLCIYRIFFYQEIVRNGNAKSLITSCIFSGFFLSFSIFFSFFYLTLLLANTKQDGKCFSFNKWKERIFSHFIFCFALYSSSSSSHLAIFSDFDGKGERIRKRKVRFSLLLYNKKRFTKLTKRKVFQFYQHFCFFFSLFFEFLSGFHICFFLFCLFGLAKNTFYPTFWQPQKDCARMHAK